MTPLPVVVLISGRGSNLKSLIEAQAAGMPIDIRAVVSNRPDAAGLDHARNAGIPVETLDHRDFPSRTAFDTALRGAIDRYAPGLVVLAGFMRILTGEFVQHYLGRMINIHPALLPAFPGLDTHRRAIEAGVAEHGATVHFVTPEVDGGPIVLQATVPVVPGDNAEQLAERVLAEEHRILPLAVGWFAEGRLAYRNGRAELDGRTLTPAASVRRTVSRQP